MKVAFLGVPDARQGLCVLAVLAACGGPATVGSDSGGSGDTDTGTTDGGDDGDGASDTDTGDSGTDTDSGAVDHDADDDGYDSEESGGDDCDDTDPNVNPGAEEIWYDGVDGDCDDGSDYDADGDGHDVASNGGDDCDDTDAEVVDCDEDESPLSHYEAAGDAVELGYISTNLSGVTWNPETGTYLAVLDSNRELVELDADLAELRTIDVSNISYTDLEDIAYLGTTSDGDFEYAMVTEQSVLYIGVVPDDGSTTINFGDFQLVTFAEDGGNSGAEGVAWDPDTETFWVCEERSDMRVLSFARPDAGSDHHYEDGLSVTEVFDAETLLGDTITDISSCIYDPRTSRLLLASHESSKIIDVDPADGSVQGSLEVEITTDSGSDKVEGITIGPEDGMLVVGEPNEARLYAYSP